MQDILGYLREKFAEKEDKPSEAILALVDSFVEHSREVLNENQPLSAGQVGGAFGVYLQDKTQLVFCGKVEEPGTMDVTNAAMPVTHGNLGNVRPGEQSMANNYTVGVTKGDSNHPT